MVAVELAFLFVFWGWIICALVFLRQTFLPRVPIVSPTLHRLPFEVVQFHATDGARLEGWKIPGIPTKPWIICCHGLGSNRSDLLQIAAILHHNAQFNLFLFDFRGHGSSQGNVTSFGWRERYDLEGALALLGQQPDIPPTPYGIYGISMGAAVALMVAATDERLGAVVADSTYPDLNTSIEQHLRWMYPRLPRIPFFWYLSAAYRARFGVWPKHVSPKRHLAALSPRPLLLIHGAQDRRVPLEGVKDMFASARQPKILYLVEGAGHLEAFAIDPVAYGNRLMTFFESSLQPLT